MSIVKTDMIDIDHILLTFPWIPRRMSILKNHYHLLFLLFLTLALPISISAQTDVSPTNSPKATPPAASKLLSGSKEKIVNLHDVVIGKGGKQDLHADIAYPADSATSLPAIIYIHGGGWFKGSYKSPLLVRTAMSGYFVASVEYRLSNVAKWPAQIQDCKLAVRWARANAAKYNINPDRIGVWGASAGGHLVACLGTMNDAKYEGDGGYPGVSSSVQAVVDFYGPVDFTHPAIYSPSAIKMTEGLFGVPFEKNPDLWKSGSPLFFVKPSDPPMLLVHGDSDTLVPTAQSTAFDEALTKAGVPHRLLLVKNAEHDLKPKPGTTIDPSYQDVLKDVVDFFDKYLKSPEAK